MYGRYSDLRGSIVADDNEGVGDIAGQVRVVKFWTEVSGAANTGRAAPNRLGIKNFHQQEWSLQKLAVIKMLFLYHSILDTTISI